MKATKFLEAQHREVEALFERIDEDHEDRATLVHELATKLAAHMAIEQDIFYPAVESVDEELIGESFEEHSIAEVALKRLLGTKPEDATFVAKVHALKDVIEHHVEEEEEELFPQVERALGNELEALGDRLEEAFAQAQEEGFDALVPEGFRHTSADEAHARHDRRQEVSAQPAQRTSPRKRSHARPG